MCKLPVYDDELNFIGVIEFNADFIEYIKTRDSGVCEFALYKPVNFIPIDYYGLIHEKLALDTVRLRVGVLKHEHKLKLIGFTTSQVDCAKTIIAYQTRED